MRFGLVMQCSEFHGIYIQLGTLGFPIFLPRVPRQSSVKPFISARSRCCLPTWPVRQIPLLRRRTLRSAWRRGRCVARLARLLLGRVAVLILLWRLCVRIRRRWLVVLWWWWGSDLFVWVLRGR